MELSDHQDTYHNSLHELKLVAHVADTVVTGHQSLQVIRDYNTSARLTVGRPALNYTLAMVDTPNTIYQQK